METNRCVIFLILCAALLFLNPIFGGIDAAKSSGKPLLKVGSNDVCGNNLCSETDLADDTSNEKLRTLLYPKQQTKKGIPIDRIKCIENFILIKKNSDGSPACVSLQSLESLLARGWGEEVLKPVNKTLN